MKFITQVLTLFAASGVLSKSLVAREEKTPEEFITKFTNTIFDAYSVNPKSLVARQEYTPEEFIRRFVNILDYESEYSKECVDDVLKVNRCFSEFKINCDSINSETCGKFYNDPWKSIPHCNDVDIFKQYLTKDQAKYSGLAFRLNCAVDEKGNECIFKYTDDTHTLVEQCKNKSCYDQYLNFIEVIKNNFDTFANLPTNKGHFNDDDLKDIESELKIIYSEKCISQHSGNVKPVPTTSANSPEPVPTTSTNSPEPVPTTSTNSPEPVPTTSTNNAEPVPTTSANNSEPVPTTSANNPEPTSSSKKIKKRN